MAQEPERSDRQAAAMDAMLAQYAAQDAARAKAPPGWYPHPTMAATQRYWDGHHWTDHIAPGAPAAPVPFKLQRPDQSGLVAAGVVLGIILPLVGFIIGVVLVSRDENKGWLCMAVSVVAFLFWASVLASNGSTY